MERQLVLSPREAASASAFSTMAVRSSTALATAALRASDSSVFLASPAVFSVSNCFLSAATSPTTAGSEVSSPSSFRDSSISRALTLGEVRRLASRSSLALRSRKRRAYSARASSLEASGNWPTSRSVSPSLTKTVPLSATRPKASAALTSASEYAACAAGAATWALAAGAFLAKAAGEGACGFGIEAGVGVAGLASGAGVVACSSVAAVFSVSVTVSSAMASSLQA